MLLHLAVCTPTKTVMVGEDSEEETRVLLTAQHGLPADTSGGTYATGTARPGESSHLGARAEHSALLRLLGTLRAQGAIASHVTQPSFFACVEEHAPLMHVVQDSLPNGTVEITVFIGKDNMQEMLGCLNK
jgi:hypothetical protein